MKKKLLLFFLLVVFSAGFIFYIRQKKAFKINSCRDCNIVFVSFDTLRADHTGFMGYKKNTTPNLDSLAKKSFVFANTVSTSSWTLPATMSWFTGVYPSTHTVLNKYTIPTKEEEVETLPVSVLPETIKTLAEMLKDSGYRTGGFTGGASLNRQFGFNRGFDAYFDDTNFGGFEESIPKALAWIQSNKKEKLFVFLHGYDIHGQYVPKKGYDKRFVDFNYKGNLTGLTEEQKLLREEGLSKGMIYLDKDDVRFLTALYDEKIQRADALFKEFLTEYETFGLMEKTIFIITSDHGEELYEHGRIDHGHSLYEELIKVPLLIKLPGNIAKKIAAQVRGIDLMPTILRLVGAPQNTSYNGQMVGVNLMPFMEGKEKKLDAFSETDYRYTTNLRSLRTFDGWKFITNLNTKVRELFFLRTDAKEQKNLKEKFPKKLEELSSRLVLLLRLIQR